jgi:hypothetical protein
MVQNSSNILNALLHSTADKGGCSFTKLLLVFSPLAIFFKIMQNYLQKTHTHCTCSYDLNSTTNIIPTPWLSLQSQLNSTHMNHHTSSSQYSIFLSSITYYIWRVASLWLVLLVCEMVRNISKSSLYFMPATIRLSKDFTWWTVYVCIHIYTCVRVCVSKHTHRRDLECYVYSAAAL